MRPVSASQLRSVSTPMTFVQRALAGSLRYAATYHLYGRSGPHAARSRTVRAAAGVHNRASSSSERSSLGNVGVPVLPAIQSMSRHVLASNTCSHARRAVPARWLYERPLMMTSAASRDRRFGSAFARLQRITADLRSDASAAPTRSEEHTSELQSRPHLVCRLL